MCYQRVLPEMKGGSKELNQLLTVVKHHDDVIREVMDTKIMINWFLVVVASCVLYNQDRIGWEAVLISVIAMMSSFGQ